MTMWQDLSSAELRARLTNRGVTQAEAVRLVNDRDRSAVAVKRINEALGRD